MIPAFHHVGHATKSISRSQKVLVALGYKPETEIIHDSLIGVTLQFWISELGPRIELVEPLGAVSPVLPILEKRAGAYHYAYEVPDLSKLDSATFPTRIRALTEPQPAVAFDGRNVQFFGTVDGAILEFIETA